MITKQFVGAVLFAALLASAPSARATIIDLTYAGTVYDSTDSNGLFGVTSKNNVYNDDSYALVLRFDLSKGTYFNNGYYNHYAGGTLNNLGPRPIKGLA